MSPGLSGLMRRSVDWMGPRVGRVSARMESSPQQDARYPAFLSSERAMTDKGSPQELEDRLALTAPEHTLRGFFFTGVFEQVRPLGDPELLRRCVDAAGGDRFMFFFSYPVGAMTRLLYTAAWALRGPQGDFGQVMRHLGQEIAPDYLESGAGRGGGGVCGGGTRGGRSRVWGGVMGPVGRKIARDYGGAGAGRVLVLLSGGEPRRLLNGFPSA